MIRKMPGLLVMTGINCEKQDNKASLDLLRAKTCSRDVSIHRKGIWGTFQRH